MVNACSAILTVVQKCTRHNLAQRRYETRVDKDKLEEITAALTKSRRIDANKGVARTVRAMTAGTRKETCQDLVHIASDNKNNTNNFESKPVIATIPSSLPLLHQSDAHI